jgi:hypothetical protein
MWHANQTDVWYIWLVPRAVAVVNAATPCSGRSSGTRQTYVILAAVESDIAETAHFAAFNYRVGKMTRAYGVRTPVTAKTRLLIEGRH